MLVVVDRRRFLEKSDTNMEPIVHSVREDMVRIVLALVLAWARREQVYSQVPLRYIEGLEVLAYGKNILEQES